MMAQKLREEAVEKERDEHFNAIRPMKPAKKEWRVKEKSSMPTLTTSDDNMYLLDDEESPLIKVESLPLTSMDINMVFTLLAEFSELMRRLLSYASVPRKSCWRNRSVCQLVSF
jgi:hypothetical protein